MECPYLDRERGEVLMTYFQLSSHPPSPIKHQNLVTKMCYWIISYVCVSRFHFLIDSRLFTPNSGHYSSKSSCSSSNGLVFTPNSSSVYVPMSTSLYGQCVGWGILLMRSVFHETSGRCEFKWVRVCKCARNYLGAINLLCQSKYQT